MDIKEIKDKRDDLAIAMLALIKKFEEETEVRVDKVDLESCFLTGDLRPLTYMVKLEVKLW